MAEYDNLPAIRRHERTVQREIKCRAVNSMRRPKTLILGPESEDEWIEGISVSTEAMR